MCFAFLDNNLHIEAFGPKPPEEIDTITFMTSANEVVKHSNAYTINTRTKKQNVKVGKTRQATWLFYKVSSTRYVLNNSRKKARGPWMESASHIVFVV